MALATLDNFDGNIEGNIGGNILCTFLNFYMVSKCSILFPDFRTLFVFVLRPFLPLSVKFLDFDENFNGKILFSKIDFWQ